MGTNGMGEDRLVAEPEAPPFFAEYGRMPSDRRQARHVRLQARFPLRVPVVVELNGPPAEMHLAGETGNLSRGGALLRRLAEAPRPGTALRVTLRLRRFISLTITGTAVWIEPDPDSPGWKLGFQFGRDLPESFVAQIAEDAFSPGPARSQ